MRCDHASDTERLEIHYEENCTLVYLIGRHPMGEHGDLCTGIESGWNRSDQYCGDTGNHYGALSVRHRLCFRSEAF